MGDELSDPELLRTALDATGLLVLVVDASGRLIAANHAFESTTARHLSADSSLWDLVELSGERSLLKAAFAALPHNAGAFPPGFLLHLVSGRGPARVVDWSTRVIRRDSEEPAVVLVGVDLSERLAAEKRLIESAARQRMILERAPVVIWSTDTELRYTSSIGAGLRQLNLEQGQVALVGTSLYQYFQTNDASHPVIAAHLRALAGERTTFDVSWLDREFQAVVEPLVDDDGETIGCLGIAIDITERAQAETKLRNSESRLRRLVDSNIMGVMFWERQGKILDANRAFLDLVGYSRNELLSGAVSWQEMTPAEYRLLDERAFDEIDAKGSCTPYEKEYVAKDGSRRPVLIGGASLEEARDGAAGTGVAFVLDLREQVRLRKVRDQLLAKEHESRLQAEKANAHLRLLVDASKRLAGMVRLDNILEALTQVLVPSLADWAYVVHQGWDGGPRLIASSHRDPGKAALLRRLHDCVPEPEAPEGAPRVFRTGELAVYSHITDDQLRPVPPNWPIVGTRDPEHLHIIRELGMRSLLCVPIPGRVGVDGVVMLAAAADPQRYESDELMLVREIVGRAAVSLENARLLTEALEAVRARTEFLSVAAHELRTPLTSSFLQIQTLRRALDSGQFDPGTAVRGVEIAERQLRRLTAQVNDLLDVSRLTTGQLPIVAQETDAVALVHQVVTTMRPELQRASCPVEISAPASLVGRWDPARITQVLTNLVSNAVKFGAGRPIEIKAEALPERARVSVRDHGEGVSEEDQARIFGRFERAASTRHFGGLGLGLYISSQIVRAHQGTLRVESMPGEGACFVMELPYR